MARALDSLALRLARGLARWAPDFAASGLRAPAFVIGCGRSGSTLLRRTLAGHPELAVFPSEGNELWHPALYPWNGTRRDIKPLWVDPAEFTQASTARRSAADVRFLKAMFGAYLRCRRGSRFVNKTEMIHFMLPEVAAWFPGARFIHLVRDGRAVALSRSRRLHTPDTAGLDLPSWMPDLSDLDGLLDLAVSYWQSSLEAVDEARAVSRLGPERFLDLTYEELCARPRETLLPVAEFLDVDPRPFADLDPTGFVDCNYKYRQELSAACVARLSGLGQRGLERWGYTDAAGVETSIRRETR
jgi:hypothetical protein